MLAQLSPHWFRKAGLLCVQLAFPDQECSLDDG